MKAINLFIIIIGLVLLPILAVGEDCPKVGSKVYVLDSYVFRSDPMWEGEFIMNATRGMEFTVVSVDENKWWYRVKAINGREGYLADSWVTCDPDDITKINNEEIILKHQEEQAKKDALNKIKKMHPSWSTKDCEIILAHKVRIGMNMEQCREAWGEPELVNNTHFKHGTHSQWCYGEYCSSALYFENGVLTVIQN